MVAILSQPKTKVKKIDSLFDTLHYLIVLGSKPWFQELQNAKINSKRKLQMGLIVSDFSEWKLVAIFFLSKFECSPNSKQDIYITPLVLFLKSPTCFSFIFWWIEYD